MLVIPAIDICGGRCVRSKPGGALKPTGYYADPVRMAKLWRVINTKVLHLMDLDGLRRDAGPHQVTRKKIGEICEAVDIPVQVRGGIRSLTDISELVELGAYRVVIGSAAIQNPDLVQEAVEQYGTSRIVVSIDIRDGRVVYEDALFTPDRDPAEFAAEMEKTGLTRILITDMNRAGGLSGVDTDLIRYVASGVSKMRITVAGGVGGYSDLVELKKLAPIGVDSVVIERALYENAFPCQQFWCWHERDQVDLDTFSTAKLRTLPQ